MFRHPAIFAILMLCAVHLAVVLSWSLVTGGYPYLSCPYLFPYVDGYDGGYPYLSCPYLFLYVDG